MFLGVVPSSGDPGPTIPSDEGLEDLWAWEKPYRQEAGLRDWKMLAGWVVQPL